MEDSGHHPAHSGLSHSRDFWHTARARRMMLAASTGPTHG
jgi:hypothetical protein